MSEEEVILYDLPGKGKCACWSLNPWKTRLSLNYKKIPYKTQWVEYPDLAPLLKSYSIPPNAPTLNPTPYTSPAIRLPSSSSSSSPTYIMDSRAIASALETTHPTPSLHLSSPTLARVEELLPKAMGPLVPVLLPGVPALLNPVSEEYFQRTRKDRFGMSLADLERERGGDKAWGEARGPLSDLGKVLGGEKKEEGGVFCEGKEVSYADFVIVGFLQFCKRIDQSYYDRVVEVDPAFGRLYDASKEWLARDDY